MQHCNNWNILQESSLTFKVINIHRRVDWGSTLQKVLVVVRVVKSNDILMFFITDGFKINIRRLFECLWA